MSSFRKFFHKSEEEKDLNKTIDKIPKSHQDLLDSYKFKLQGGNTLDDDDKHIGYMDAGDEEIAVAAPWNYGREFAILHEIAHVVWENIPNNIRANWEDLVKKTKHIQDKKPNTESDSLDQPAEELFCMSYANYYAKHKITTYSNPDWMDFISCLPS